MRRHLRSTILVLSLLAGSTVGIACTPGGSGATSAPGVPSDAPAPSTAGGYSY